LNRWNHTQSNPINYTDPSGHSSIPNLGKAALNQTLKRVLPNGTMGLMGNCSDDCFLQVKKCPIYYRKSAHFEKRKKLFGGLVTVL